MSKRLGEFLCGITVYQETDWDSIQLGEDGWYVPTEPEHIEVFITELRAFAALARDPAAGVVAAARAYLNAETDTLSGLRTALRNYDAAQEETE